MEKAAVPRSVHANREIVLWMISPVKHEREPGDKIYTCPDVTLGSYYSGPVRVSLVDTASGKVINTVPIHPQDEDSFDIPYRILPNYYYLVPGAAKDVEGKPSLLRLRDFNGDGMALEFAFYQAEACMGLPTTLLGYSIKQDKVIQYPVEPRVSSRQHGSAKPSGETTLDRFTWVQYLFSRKPVAPGIFRYHVDFSGRGGANEIYNVHYDAAHEKFAGSLIYEIWQPPF